MNSETPHLANTPAREPERPGPPVPPLTKLRRFLKRLMVVGLGLLVIAIVIFFMLPYWMSNEQGRNYVLGRLNRRINGTISVGSWKLEWFSGTEIHNLSLALPDGKVVMTCPRIQTELTLWSLLWGNFEVGNTRLDSPNVMAAKYADGSNDISRLLLPREGETAASPLKTLKGYIVCRNGFLELTGPGGGTPLLISEISAEIPIASRSAPIHLRANGFTAGAGGSEPVDITADLPSPSSWEANPYSLLSSIQLRAANIPTGTLAEWVGLDRRWEQSLGPVLTQVRLISEPAGVGESVITATVTGTAGTVQARLRLTAGSGRAQISLVEQKDPALLASLRLSEPLRELLAHVNPVFNSVSGMDDVVEIATGKLTVDLTDPWKATGQVYVRVPPMTLKTGGLVREILEKTSGVVPGGGAVRATVSPMSLAIAGGKVECGNVSLTLLPTRQVLRFSGAVGFDSKVDLILSTKIPRELGSTTIEAPIGGTVEKPELRFDRPGAEGAAATRSATGP